MEEPKEESAAFVGHVAKQQLSADEVARMRAQDTRLISEFRAMQLEKNAQKHWDLFYKRNEVRFFKDRHWTTREFEELLRSGDDSKKPRRLLEVGCGVGNLMYPLLEDDAAFEQIYACDLSPRAIEFVKSNKLYDPNKVKAFQCDVTDENCFRDVDCLVDVTTLVFVLSTIHPKKFHKVISNIWQVTSMNGIVLFRDYGRYDMAQLRFKPGHKISENFYMRQDGTRSYYFTTEEIRSLFESIGFRTVDCSYIQRRTVNLKEGIDVPRIFVQAKFTKT
ncbi:methyltransferase-like protein 6 [Copidosoma floridanum]|uniref:methyltransferase-like protein 6 n=1 Tax=Copidosoma floridanum TaxID=29053 RepID=UPI0006C93F4F|nr:methyltransferase-like protein 6 [Copidosoma floridanum]